MTIGKDFQNQKKISNSSFQNNNEMNSSKTSFRIKSRKGNRSSRRGLKGSNSIKKLAPIKGNKLGKIVLKGSKKNLKNERKKPPVNLTEHFMKKFNPRNTSVKKKKVLQKKFFYLPFQVFNIVKNGDEEKLNSIKPNLKSTLERWRKKVQKVILMDFQPGDNLGQKMKLKKVEIEVLIEEEKDENFKEFFEKISKIKDLNRECFSLYKSVKDAKRAHNEMTKILKEIPKFSIFLKKIVDLKESVTISIDRMTFSTAYKMLLSSLKPNKEVLSENEYLNYLFIETFFTSTCKIEEIFKISKLHFGLVLSKKNYDLLKKHCTFWAKIVKTNLLHLANLQKNFSISFFSNYFKHRLKPKKINLMKISEFCNIVLSILDFLNQDKEKIQPQIEEIRKIILCVPKGIDIMDQKNIQLWDTIVVKILKIIF